MRTIREIRDAIEENSYAKNKLEVEITVIEDRIKTGGDKGRDKLQERIGNLRSGIRKHDLAEQQLRAEYGEALSERVTGGSVALEDGDGTQVDGSSQAPKGHATPSR